MPGCGAVSQLGVDELLYVAVENACSISRGHAGSRVLDPLFGIEEVAADCVSPADLALFAVDLGHVAVALGLLSLIEPGCQHPTGGGSVLVLGAFVLALRDDPRGQVGQPDSR